jgi:hypothetical protein
VSDPFRAIDSLPSDDDRRHPCQASALP